MQLLRKRRIWDSDVLPSPIAYTQCISCCAKAGGCADGSFRCVFLVVAKPCLLGKLKIALRLLSELQATPGLETDAGA